MKLQYTVGCILVGAVKDHMRLARMLSIFVAALGTVSMALAANYNDLVAQGYRWVTVDGPYGCPSKTDLQQITRNRTEEAEFGMAGQLRAYYLIPGNVVQVVEEDKVSGMSKIRIDGIVKELWTFTKFLSRRPIKDTYGVIEIPETASFNPYDYISRYGSR